MSTPIIQVENLGKRYIIGHQKNAGAFRYQALGETMTQWGRSLYQRLRHPLSPNREAVELEEFWATRDVNFEVNPGDRVGIIGHNGAGKSTLLKLLCRITEPTTGRITIRGRVASLLEVGTGFHPELSGRENIYMNGAILGMHRAEIRAKFDEIIEFAGVEKFLDTPVKRYSSGMYVRLAFAVAAHLEPEILLIDEVLAVGDAAFQKKCLGKMEDISRNSGRTILFVSHNMGAIQQLCNRGILLNHGQIESMGNIDRVIDQYSATRNRIDSENIAACPRESNISGKMHFTRMLFKDMNGAVTLPVPGKPLRIELQFFADVELKNCRISIGVDNFNGRMAVFSSEMTNAAPLDLPRSGTLECFIPEFPFTQGSYYLTLFAEVNGVIADWVKNIPLSVEDGDFFGTGKNVPIGQAGIVTLVRHRWSVLS